MKNKLKKIAILFLVVLSWIIFAVFVFNYVKEFPNNSATNRLTSLLELFGYLILISSFSYSNINWIFISWKKIIVFLANPSVSWKMTTVYTVNQRQDRLTMNIFNDLSKKFVDLKFADCYNDELSRYEIIVNKNKYVLSIEELDEDEFQIRIISDYRISYRESLKDLYSTYSEVESDIRTNFVHPADISYLLSISLDNFNPFYKVYLNNFEKMDSLNFSIIYDVYGAKVSIQNNKISIQSDSLSHIKKISKEYIAVSNDSLLN